MVGMGMTGYVWSQEEVSRFLGIFAEREARTHCMTVGLDIATTPEFAREVLPPCFEVPAEPSVSVGVTILRESYHGAMAQGHGIAEEEEVAHVAIKAVYGSYEGWYSLTEMVSGDFQVSTGREFWGNPKKRGNAQIMHDGQTIYAYGERAGVRFLEIEGKLGEMRPDELTNDDESIYFAIKPNFDPKGGGLLDDPLLIVMNTGGAVTGSQVIEDARVTLRGNGRDPVDTVPLLAHGPARYGTSIGIYDLLKVVPLEDGNAYLPFLLGRLYDDVPSLMRENARALTTTSR